MLFWFRKLSVLISGVFGFSFFAIEHIRKPGNYGKIFISSFFEVLKLFIWFEALFVSILCDQETTLKICSNLSRSTYHLNLKVAFLLLKPKLYLDNKVIRASFNHLLRAVTARSTLFEKRNAFFSTKASKNTCRLGACSVLNALNLQK